MNGIKNRSPISPIFSKNQIMKIKNNGSIIIKALISGSSFFRFLISIYALGVLIWFSYAIVYKDNNKQSVNLYKILAT